MNFVCRGYLSLCCCQDGMVRKEIVCLLRTIVADWRKAITAKERTKLRNLLGRLEQIVPSPQEIHWSGIGKAASVSSAALILKGPEINRLKVLKERWKESYRRLPAHAKKLAGPTVAEEAFLQAVQDINSYLQKFVSPGEVAPDTMHAALALVRVGFQVPADLDSAEADCIRCKDGIDDASNALVNRAIAHATTEGLERQRGLKRFRDGQPCGPIVDAVQVAALTRVQSAAEIPQAVGTLLGPRKGVLMLTQVVAETRQPGILLENIRIETVLQSAPKSLDSYASALRCWGAFADGVLGLKGSHLPPSAAGIFAWSRVFRNDKVFGNYVSGVRFGCDLVGIAYGQDIKHVVRRAKLAIRNRVPPSSCRRFIKRDLLARLALLCLALS